MKDSEWAAKVEERGGDGMGMVFGNYLYRLLLRYFVLGGLFIGVKYIIKIDQLYQTYME